MCELLVSLLAAFKVRLLPLGDVHPVNLMKVRFTVFTSAICLWDGLKV